MLCQYIYLDIYTLYHNNQRRAGVVKLVDAGDSKSPDSCSHVGSIPTSGTKDIDGGQPASRSTGSDTRRSLLFLRGD